MSAHKQFPETEGFISIGKIVKAHGIKGEIKVYPFSGDPHIFDDFGKVSLARDSGELEEYEVIRSRPQGDLAVLQLNGVVDRDAADGLRGCEILVDETLFPEPEENEFYWHEYIGLRVETAIGKKLGSVSDIFATGAHDILVVKDGKREYLIPAQDQFIKEVDLDRGLIVIEEVPGLLDINA
mgnify:CR=1 FL=1